MSHTSIREHLTTSLLLLALIAGCSLFIDDPVSNVVEPPISADADGGLHDIAQPDDAEGDSAPDDVSALEDPTPPEEETGFEDPADATSVTDVVDDVIDVGDDVDPDVALCQTPNECGGCEILTGAVGDHCGNGCGRLRCNGTAEELRCVPELDLCKVGDRDGICADGVCIVEPECPDDNCGTRTCLNCSAVCERSSCPSCVCSGCLCDFQCSDGDGASPACNATCSLGSTCTLTDEQGSANVAHVVTTGSVGATHCGEGELCTLTCLADSLCAMYCEDATTCETQTSTNASSLTQCGEEGACSVSCDSGATCEAYCDETSESCTFSCLDNLTSPAMCDFDCNENMECHVTCAPGASCLIRNCPGCDIPTACAGGVRCADGTIACNGATCPAP